VKARRMKPRPVKCRHRRAFSLLEVILAIAIFAGAMTVLGELLRIGVRHAESARDLTRAELLCESKLAEITSGIAVAEAVNNVPCEFDSDWLYSVAWDPIDEEGLIAVRVTVTRDAPRRLRPVAFSLSRWMRDPGVIAEEQEEEAAASPSGGKSTNSGGAGGEP